MGYPLVIFPAIEVLLGEAIATAGDVLDDDNLNARPGRISRVTVL
jgi:hypothetical protein